MEYITIATTGVVQDFGELTSGGLMASNAASNPIRGLFFGGAPSNTQNIDLINIASTGNAVKFGDMTTAKAYRNCANSPTRAIAGGGQTPGSTTVIDMVAVSYTHLRAHET